MAHESFDPYQLDFDGFTRWRCRERLTELARYGIRQSHVAKALGWHQGTLSRFLSGESDMTLRKVSALMDMIGAHGAPYEPRIDSVAKRIREAQPPRKRRA